MLALGPGEDTSFLLNSLIVVIIGGMGSLGGAAVGALAARARRRRTQTSTSCSATATDDYSILLTFALLIFMLAIRPLGLFGRPA